MNLLTAGQCRAVRYYIGDVQGNDPFWGDGKAYVVLNSLFFPGIETERARAAEGKRLNSAILEDEDRLISLLRDLISAFQPGGDAREVYRVERLADYLQMCTEGRTMSFTSTCRSGFLPQYGDRVGVVLMRFRLQEDTPCIIMAEQLSQYAKADEDEVLLPPGLRLTFHDYVPSESENRITDANGNPPARAVIAVPGQMMPGKEDPAVLPAGGNLAGQRVYTALMNGGQPGSDDAALYTRWKSALTANLF